MHIEITRQFTVSLQKFTVNVQWRSWIFLKVAQYFWLAIQKLFSLLLVHPNLPFFLFIWTKFTDNFYKMSVKSHIWRLHISNDKWVQSNVKHRYAGSASQNTGYCSKLLSKMLMTSTVRAPGLSMHVTTTVESGTSWTKRVLGKACYSFLHWKS